VVGSVVGREGAERRLNAACVATHDIFALPAPGFVDKVDPIEISDEASALRFHAKTQHLPSEFAGRHFTTMRRLHMSSADLLWQLWDDARRVQRKTKRHA